MIKQFLSRPFASHLHRVLYLLFSFFSLHFKVECNGNCLFAVIKKSLQVWHSGAGGAVDGERQLPYYLNRYFRRQVINWMVENCQKVHKYMGSALKATYGIPDHTGSHGGPFSYKTYLNRLMDKSFWGDEDGPLVSVHDVGPQNNGGQFKNPARVSSSS